MFKQQGNFKQIQLNQVQKKAWRRLFKSWMRRSVMRDKLQRYQFRLLKKLLVRCSTMSTWSKCSSMQVMWKQKRWLTKTKQQWFNAFREADAITSNISLAILSARDQFWDTVLFSFHQHRICEFWDSLNLDTFFMFLPTSALIRDTTTSTVFSFPSLKKPCSCSEWLQGDLWRSRRSWRRGRHARCVYYIL